MAVFFSYFSHRRSWWLETIPSWITESRWDASKLLFRIRSSELEYGVPMRRIEASFPDSELRVGIRSPDATHRSLFSGFEAPSWNTESRCDASKLLFRIRSSELEYGVPMRRIEASFPDSRLRVGIRSPDGTHRSFFSGFGVPSSISEFRCVAPSFEASSRRHPVRRFLSKDVRCKSPGFLNDK